MDFREFTAGADDDNRRLDRIIRKISGKENLSGLYKAIRKGLVKLNGKKTEVSEHVFKGDKIKVPEFLLQDESSENKKSCSVCAKKTDFQIIFQNEDLLVINKPYDVPVHGSADSLEKSAVEFYREKFPEKKSISFTPGPLHRLDRKTTGLLAFSMSLAGARWFSENIASHSIKKVYSAVFQGKITEAQKWTDFISKEYSEESSFQTVKVAGTQLSEKYAVAETEIFPLRHFEYKGIPCTIADIEIKTGRTHQIRAQAAFHGFPLLGDTAYGGTEITAGQDFFLHAKTLFFPENRLPGLPRKLDAKPPFAFEKFCKTYLLNI